MFCSREMPMSSSWIIGRRIFLLTRMNRRFNEWLAFYSSPPRFSYQYAERSIQNGRLEDLEKYRIGPSAQRPMGASHIPKKRTRRDYSLKEDQILYDYLYPYEQAENAPISGQVIYQQLAEKASTVRIRPGHHLTDVSLPVPPTFMAVLALAIPQDPTRKASSWRRHSNSA